MPGTTTMRLLSCIWVYVHVCVDNIKKATFGVCLLLAGVRILLISGRELVLNLRYVRRLADVEGYICRYRKGHHSW